MGTGRQTRGKRWLLLGLALGVAACLGEVAQRLVARARYRAQVRAFASDLLELAAGKPYFFRLKPDLDLQVTIADPSGQAPTVCRYTTGHDRLRSRPPSSPAGTAAASVLFVGDSYTFGTGVQDGEAYPHVVEAALRQRGVDTVAINAGVPGFNSAQEADLLAELLPVQRPAAVVVGYVMNDTEPLVIAPMPPEYAYRDCGSWLWEDCKPLVNQLGNMLGREAPLCTIHKQAPRLDYLRGFAPGSPLWPRARAALLSMQAQCRRAAVPLLLAILPDFTKPFGDACPYRSIHAQVMAAATAAGLPVIDLLPPLAAQDHRQLQVKGDGHPNAAGHRLLGELLAPRIRALLGRD
ncbi:MAG TPA: GDSL-type esterase/lipase family protein [Planctomycetota bacterium]|nr:GDSL-type esterase/lipase family protein [Planctomycetota bacterium]